MKKSEGGMKVVAGNKKAHFEYFIEDAYEAGIVLTGCEVKSVRAGKMNINDAYCIIREGRATLINSYIANFQAGSTFNKEERRTRDLLLNKAEIAKIAGKVREKGYTLVPTKAYFKHGFLKIEIGLAKGKQMHDKRETIKQRDIQKDVARQIKGYK